MPITPAGLWVPPAGLEAVGDTHWKWTAVEVADDSQKLELLRDIAIEGSDHPLVRELAFNLTARWLGDPWRQAYELHRWMRHCVRYLDERTETFQRPWVTLTRAGGDCDDHATAQIALALAVELPVLLGLWDPLTHASVAYALEGREVWAESTIGANFGEHPLDALARLGESRRGDIGHRPRPT